MANFASGNSSWLLQNMIGKQRGRTCNLWEQCSEQCTKVPSWKSLHFSVSSHCRSHFGYVTLWKRSTSGLAVVSCLFIKSTITGVVLLCISLIISLVKHIYLFTIFISTLSRSFPYFNWIICFWHSVEFFIHFLILTFHQIYDI